MRFVSGCTFLTYQEFFRSFRPRLALTHLKSTRQMCKEEGKREGEKKGKEREEERIEGSKDEGKEGVYHY